MKQILFFVCAVLILASCTKEVKIDIPGYEEQLVIDGRIETDQPPLVILSKTKDIYAPTDLDAYLNGFVSGAVVTVSDGSTSVVLDEICSDNLPPGTEEQAAALFGIPVDQLANYHICAYTTFNTAIWGQVGKTYSLTVQFEGKTYTSSTQILQPTALDSVFWQQDEDAPAGFGFSWARLSDPAGQYDAYMWEVKRLDLDAGGNPKDNAYKATFAPVWDDEFIDGKTFDFAFENPLNDPDEAPDDQRWYYGIGDTVVIKLSKVESNVFEFLEKKYLQLQTTGNPFASPTMIPTNIIGGAQGVWAGYSPHFDTLICQ
ncbi:MAG: DUF4249 family protein [Fluviicola sp.]|nr:DUF4249 family protein [Fluviicola sp.]